MDLRTAPVMTAWLDLAARNRGSERFQVSHAAFRSIVSRHMPTIAEVGGSIEVPISNLRLLVQEMVREGRLTLDETGDVITGAGGISLVESRHELNMYGRRYWVWCALDAVGIPAGLGVDATVYGHCTDTGDPVEVGIVDGSGNSIEPESVAIALKPPSLDQSLHECCCSEIGFFADARSVPPETVAVTIADAMGLGRQLWRDGIPL